MSEPLYEALLYIADSAISLGLVKGSLIVGMALLLEGALRRASAAVRAGVWSLAIVALCALPVLTHLVPWWEVGFIDFPRALFVNEPALQPPAADALRVSGIPERPVPAIWLAIAWAAGAAVVALQFLWQRIAAELTARTGEPARDRRTLDTLRRISLRLRLPRAIRVIYSDAIAAPFAFGIRRPTVMLPHAAHGWSAGQLDAVMRHELAHITRRDYALLLAGEVVRVLYWFNPVVWLALSALRRRQDAACDDHVLRGGVPAAIYARHLLGVAHAAITGPRVSRAALPLVRAHGLRERIGAVLDRTSDRRPVTRTAVVWLGLLGSLAAVTLASANPWICESSGAAAAHAAEAPAAPLGD